MDQKKVIIIIEDDPLSCWKYIMELNKALGEKSEEWLILSFRNYEALKLKINELKTYQIDLVILDHDLANEKNGKSIYKILTSEDSPLQNLDGKFIGVSGNPLQKLYLEPQNIYLGKKDFYKIREIIHRLFFNDNLELKTK